MSKTILSEVDGFTPLIDAIAKEHGIITAAVFGRMWRYCQGDRGVCQATLERIGDDLGIDKATAQRHAAKLCELGYLEDTTPGLRNKPHTYRDTGKAALAINVHVAQSNVTLQSATSRCTEQRHVAESRLKKEVKKETKKEPADKPLAVEAFRKSAKAYPAKGQWDAIAATVGDDAKALDLWERVVAGYVLKGWNPRNVSGMLDYYKRGEVPGAKGYQGPPASNGQGSARVLTEEV